MSILMWANLAKFVRTTSKAHEKGEHVLNDDLKETLNKEYTLLLQSCIDISVK